MDFANSARYHLLRNHLWCPNDQPTMFDLKRTLPDIATIQPDRLIKYRISEDRFYGEVLLPGLWYTDFDKKIGGKWTMYSMMKYLEIVRYSTLMRNGAYYYPELYNDGSCTMFIASHAFSVAEETHHVCRDHTWGYNTPYLFTSYLSNIGRSSLTFSLDMFDHRSGRKLMSATTVMVHIDRKTRKPCHFPEWFLNRAQTFLTANKLLAQSIERVEVPSVPRNAFGYEIKSLQSDCDSNLHVNQAVYLRICSDVGALATEAGTYKHFTKDIGMYALESLCIQYLGEAVMDEKILVYTWEDSEEEKTLQFVMQNDSKRIFHAKLRYHKADGTPGFTSISKL